MLSLPRDISNHDIEQWLNSGWFFANIGGKEEICQLYGADDRESIYVSNVDGVKSMVTYRDILAHWPRCGAINVGPVALLVQRRQRQQYRRTYNSRQVELVIPRKWEALKKYGETVRNFTPDHPEVLKSLFNPDYPTLDEARDELSSGEALSRAINPHIIIVGQGDTTLVYYRGTCAARIVGDRLVAVGADKGTMARLLKHFRGKLRL